MPFSPPGLNCAITHTHTLVPVFVHKSQNSQHKECDTESRQGGAAPNEALWTSADHCQSASEGRSRFRQGIRLTGMKYCSSQTYTKIVQHGTHLSPVPLSFCAPSLFTSLLRGRWGTFLGSTSYTLGINPLQLCPLLPDILPPLSCLPPPISLCRPLLTPAGPITISIHFSQPTHKCHMYSRPTKILYIQWRTRSSLWWHTVTYTHIYMHCMMLGLAGPW